jgi:hypothetical protein
MAKVFQVTNQGATILKASPSSRPVDLKGWVAQSTNKGELKYSALSAGTQFTCFTGTKVQILTQKLGAVGRAYCGRAAGVLDLLALLVQKYKY